MSPQQAASTFMNYDVTYCHVFVIGHQIRDTEIVWQTTLTLPLFLFTSSKINHSNFFTLFISPQSFFIIIQIKKKKKNHYKTKFFHFSIKRFQILYHINHFLLLFNQLFHNTITYQRGPLSLLRPTHTCYKDKTVLSILLYVFSNGS
jgi:hypothetical protein